MWFKSLAAKEKESMFADAVKLALVDGRVTEGEMRSLAVAGKNLGLTDRDMKKVLENPGEVKSVVPRDDQEKLKHVLRLVSLMVVDGQIERREMDFCTSRAAQMGLRPSLVSDLVRDFVTKLQILTKAKFARKHVDTRASLEAEIEQFLRDRQ